MKYIVQGVAYETVDLICKIMKIEKSMNDETVSNEQQEDNFDI